MSSSKNPWYHLVVTDKPDYYGNQVWIWRIVNSDGHIVGQGTHQFRTEEGARKAARRILAAVRT